MMQMLHMLLSAVVIVLIFLLFIFYDELANWIDRKLGKSDGGGDGFA